MAYTPYYPGGWLDQPSTTTPIIAAALNTIEAGIVAASAIISGQYLHAPVVYAPGTQTLLTVSSTTMAAFSSANVNTGNFSAPPSGSVVVTASFVMEQSAAAGGAIGLAAHGTVTPILSAEWIFQDSAANIPRPLSIPFVVTGLTPSTSYNFDLVGAMSAGDTLSVLAIGVSSVTPTVTSGGCGGPVTVTVQAI